MMKRHAVLLTVLLCFAYVPASAWWCTGHMLIAEMAKQQMSSTAVKKVEGYASWLSDNGPFDKIPDMMQAACWADDVRYNDRATAQWHYNNEAVDPDSWPIPGCPIQDDNVIAAVTQMNLAMQAPSANQWEMSYAVINYIHFVGDIHQPLHNAELFSSLFPNGDEGGNAFNVTLDGHRTNLHAIWDSVCNEFAQDFTRPLDDSSKAFITQKASALIAKWKDKIPTSTKQVTNATVMHDDAYQAAVDYAYAKISPGDSITDTYLAACTPSAERQVALAGFRLGYELERLFGKKSAP